MEIPKTIIPLAYRTAKAVYEKQITQLTDLVDMYIIRGCKNI